LTATHEVLVVITLPSQSPPVGVDNAMNGWLNELKREIYFFPVMMRIMAGGDGGVC